MFSSRTLRIVHFCSSEITGKVSAKTWQQHRQHHWQNLDTLKSKSMNHFDGALARSCGSFILKRPDGVAVTLDAISQAFDFAT
jgi:hypothetical protein